MKRNTYIELLKAKLRSENYLSPQIEAIIDEFENETANFYSVAHGHWIHKATWKDKYVCSNCSFEFNAAQIGNFCKNCGAKMNDKKGCII